MSLISKFNSCSASALCNFMLYWTTYYWCGMLWDKIRIAFDNQSKLHVQWWIAELDVFFSVDIHNFVFESPMALFCRNISWVMVCTSNYTRTCMMGYRCHIVSKSHDIFHTITKPSIRCACTVGHDDVIKWKHFPRHWPFVRGIHRWPVNSPHKRPVTRRFDVFLDLRLNKPLSKQSWSWGFEAPSRPSWRHSNEEWWHTQRYIYELEEGVRILVI